MLGACVYAVHDKPLPVADALYLGPDYITCLNAPERHSRVPVRRATRRILAAMDDAIEAGTESQVRNVNERRQRSQRKSDRSGNFSGETAAKRSAQNHHCYHSEDQLVGHRLFCLPNRAMWFTETIRRANALMRNANIRLNLPIVKRGTLRETTWNNGTARLPRISNKV